MPSFRYYARCLGLTGDISVRQDFLGYSPRDEEFGEFLAVEPTSLATQMRRLDGRRIDVNLIRVGFDALPDDVARRTVEREFDCAIQGAREIYATVDLAIGRVERWDIPTDISNGYEHIGDRSEAKALTQEFSMDNDGIDAFWVLSCPEPPPFRARGEGGFEDPDDPYFAGISPRPGPCDKDAWWTSSGVVIAITRYQVFSTAPNVSDTRIGRVLSGNYLAHEIGHYLGLPHRFDDNNNLMFHKPEGPIDTLTASQGETMRSHCLVKPPCGTPRAHAHGGAVRL